MRTENNLFIKETHTNDTNHYSMGSGEWYETFTSDTAILFKSLQKEYGKATKMYVDTDKGAKQIGWVFTKLKNYDDCKDKYLHSAWIEVSATKPVTKCHTENINYPF